MAFSYAYRIGEGMFCLLLEWLYIYSPDIYFFAGLTELESLNLDSCKIGDEGLATLRGTISHHLAVYNTSKSHMESLVIALYATNCNQLSKTSSQITLKYSRYSLLVNEIRKESSDNQH